MGRAWLLIGVAGCAGTVDDGLTLQTPAPAQLRRLTITEYTNAIHDLVDPSIAVPTDLEAIDSNGFGFTTIGAGQVIYSEQAAERLLDVALTAARGVLGDDTKRTGFVGCSPTTTSDPCVTDFLKRFGRLAFRRALSDDELSRYQAIVTSTGDSDVWGGLSYAVAGMLSSPNFVFRAEMGEPAPGRDGVLRYTGYDMASRLSFLIWQTTPDDALLTAAENGSLTSNDGLAEQLDRLLTSPRAAPALLNFFREHLQLGELATLVKDTKTFPEFSTTLASSMQTEIEMTVQALAITQNADLRNLFDTRTTFVNGELAKLYGLAITPGDQFVKADFPSDGDRAGLFGFAGVLALQSHAASASPTLRGRFLRERLLGQVISPPPPTVNTAGFEAPEAGAHRTMRERLSQHANDPACAGCHLLMDPPGLGLEHFDGLGRYRSDDQGLALETASTIDGQAFDGPGQLGALLKNDPRVTANIVRQLYRYSVGHVETSNEQPLLDALTTYFSQNGFQFTTLARQIVMSDGFRSASVSR